MTGAISAHHVLVASAQTSSAFGAPRNPSWRPTDVVRAPYASRKPHSGAP